MFGICQLCYCSYGSAQDRKHCCWVGLILGYYSTAWPLSLNYSKIRQCCATDWTTFHCNIELTELRPDNRSFAACDISKAYRKQPDNPIIATLPISSDVWKAAIRFIWCNFRLQQSFSHYFWHCVITICWHCDDNSCIVEYWRLCCFCISNTSFKDVYIVPRSQVIQCFFTRHNITHDSHNIV